MENNDTNGSALGVSTITVTVPDTVASTLNAPPIEIPEYPEQIPSDNLANVETPQAIPTTSSAEHSDTPVLPHDTPPENVDNMAKSEDLSTLSSEPLQGEVVEKNKGGRPSKYNDEKLKIAQEYFIKCLGLQDGKKRMPLLEELARLCDVHGETLENWCEEQPMFFETIKKIKELQKERIVQLGFGAKNPTFAIFMLKANHGMIESEKRILTGEKQGEPMQVSVMDYKSAKQLPEQVAHQIIEEGSE